MSWDWALNPRDLDSGFLAYRYPSPSEISSYDPGILTPKASSEMVSEKSFVPAVNPESHNHKHATKLSEDLGLAATSALPDTNYSLESSLSRAYNSGIYSDLDIVVDGGPERGEVRIPVHKVIVLNQSSVLREMAGCWGVLRIVDRLNVILCLLCFLYTQEFTEGEIDSAAQAEFGAPRLKYYIDVALAAAKYKVANLVELVHQKIKHDIRTENYNAIDILEIVGYLYERKTDGGPILAALLDCIIDKGLKLWVECPDTEELLAKAPRFFLDLLKRIAAKQRNDDYPGSEERSRSTVAGQHVSFTTPVIDKKKEQADLCKSASQRKSTEAAGNNDSNNPTTIYRQHQESPSGSTNSKKPPA